VILARRQKKKSLVCDQRERGLRGADAIYLTGGSVRAKGETEREKWNTINIQITEQRFEKEVAP